MIKLIVAVANNGVIGGPHGLLWHEPEDLAYFKSLTINNTVLMGSYTYESIGRPLPNRRNVVITTRPDDFACQNIITYTSFGDALFKEAYTACARNKDLYIIGGGKIYEQALPFVEKLYITFIDKNYANGTVFFDWDKENFILEDVKESSKEYMSFATFQRKPL
jgi:dihydrofolate reductase